MYMDLVNVIVFGWVR